MNPIGLKPKAYLTFIKSVGIYLFRDDVNSIQKCINTLFSNHNFASLFKKKLFSTGSCWLNASVKGICAPFWQVAAVFPLSIWISCLAPLSNGNGLSNGIEQEF